MKKKLEDMTLEELWNLFPIFLTNHKECWKNWFKEEQYRLTEILPMQKIVRISHIGSTSVSTIYAKPIVDILIEIIPDYNMKDIKDLIESNGYICMSKSSSRLSLNKGYTVDGFEERVFHLHIRYVGDNDELFFRDYLIDHPSVAKEYEKLKLDLWKKYEHNRDAYTDSKLDFVREFTEKAKVLYSNRYN
ncbi:GrpB family protein [Clostridioides difficile]|uniref:GrpB family protein n=1 Tax=Clostridioides difficile TaxID=1496 RepID=A0A9P4DBC9_CLODI|nr:GrpB family protein [Clostridioides difficile]MDC0804284.1 GrpB family protein [Clostridium paraputrificum]AWH76351.1 GrpB family protein [Clostridioides difficile]AWH80127.1 GrpB family protein [Clostridioides difficile]AXU45220.1 glutamate-rich protein GrpB [Clostridioides difficile]AXU48918.1 glutamate-rich protein GrpB [Clostridioides difficile]